MNKKITRLDHPNVEKQPSIKDDYSAIHFVELCGREGEKLRPKLFQVKLRDLIIGHLYLNALTYTLVWNSAQAFRFNEPFVFIDLQFSHLPFHEIQILDPVLPKRKRSDVSGRLEHFYYDQSTVTLVQSNEPTLVEYDLLNSKTQQLYLNTVQKPTASSNLTLARYDFGIVSKGRRFDCCFTGERPSNQDTGGWEFAIKCSRIMPLKERTLKWVSKTHDLKVWSQKTDFKKSVSTLNELVGLNPNARDAQY